MAPHAPETTPRPRAIETIRLYASDWAAFRVWCRQQGCAALPATAATLAAYLAACSGRLSHGALARRVAAIADQHRQSGHPSPAADPAVKAILRDARRAATPQRPPPLPSAQLGRMAATCPGDLAGLRDRALLLLAAATGLGRAGLIGLDAENLRFTQAGVELVTAERIRALAVPRAAPPGTCPVQALEEWLRVSDCRFGPVFRKVDRWGNVEHRRLGTDAIRRIWARRLAALRRSQRVVASAA